MEHTTITTRDEARKFVGDMIANLSHIATKDVVVASIKADFEERAKRAGFSWELDDDTSDRHNEAVLVLSVLDEF